MSMCFSSPCCGYDINNFSTSSSPVAPFLAAISSANPHNNSIDMDMDDSDDELIESVFERAYYKVNQLTNSIPSWMMASADEKANVGKNYLYKVIESRSWDAVLDLIQNDPSEAAKWITRDEKYSWRLLPIHAAVIFKAPEYIIEALLKAYPDGALAGDNKGMTPLHLAFRHGASDATLFCLLSACPMAVGIKDKNGRVPLERHRSLFIPSNRDHSLTKKVSGFAKYVSIAVQMEKEAITSQLTTNFNTKLKQIDSNITKLNANLENALKQKEETVARLTADFEAKLKEKETYIASLVQQCDAKLKAKDSEIAQILADVNAKLKGKDSIIKKVSADFDAKLKEDVAFTADKCSAREMALPEKTRLPVQARNIKAPRNSSTAVDVRKQEENRPTSYKNGSDTEGVHLSDSSTTKLSRSVKCKKERLISEAIDTRDQEEEERCVQTSADHSKGVLEEESAVDEECVTEKQQFQNTDIQGTDSVLNKNKPSLKKQVLIARLRERHNNNPILAKGYNSYQGQQYCNENLGNGGEKIPVTIKLETHNQGEDDRETRMDETTSFSKKHILLARLCDHHCDHPVLTDVQNDQGHPHCNEQHNLVEVLESKQNQTISIEKKPITNVVRFHDRHSRRLATYCSPSS